MIRPFLTLSLSLTIAMLLTSNAIAQDVFDGDEREVWAESILKRFERANRAVLNQTEAVVQSVKNRATLERIVNEKRGWKKELADLIYRLDSTERRAVKLLARKYRIQVYQTFRSQREVLVQRHAAWKLVMANWKADGRPKYQRNKLVDWLLAATAASTSGSVARLPSVPKFEAKASEVLATLPKKSEKLEIRVHPIEAPLPQVLPSKKVETREPSPQMTVRPKTASEPMTQTLPQTNVPHRKSVEHRPITSVAGSVKSIERRSAVLPPMEKRIEVKTPTVTIHPSEQKPPVTPNIVEQSDKAPPLPSVGVNIDELTVRIAGNNMAIRTLESELYTKTDWNVDQLASFVARLEMLVVRENDLTLFCELISPDERRLVGQLESPKSLVDELSAIILKSRTRTAGDWFVGTPAERQAVLDRLEKLSSQLFN